MDHPTAILYTIIATIILFGFWLCGALSGLLIVLGAFAIVYALALLWSYATR